MGDKGGVRCGFVDLGYMAFGWEWRVLDYNFRDFGVACDQVWFNVNAICLLWFGMSR